MKIAVTTERPELDSPVDPRFGRAKHFAIVDAATKQVTFLDNIQNLNATQGAGIQAARTIIDAGCRVLITGHVGPKAYTTLQAGGIQTCTGATGTLLEAVDKWEAGGLETADKPNVEGHWA